MIHKSKRPKGEDIQLPVISIPINVYERLLKIAFTMGIPAQMLGESAITKWVLKNWKYERSEPIKRG